MTIEWLQQQVAEINTQSFAAAQQRQNTLTKPPGSLGRLEQLAMTLAAMQGKQKPGIDKVHISVFAADHGIAEEGVSAFPQAVTVEMIRNFSRGGAAICVLAKQLGAQLEVINLGTVLEHEDLPQVRVQAIAPGTANFSQQAAMSDSQLAEALQVGADAAIRAQQYAAQLFIGGDMGIANTTSATAVASALLEMPAEQLAGPGTGLDAAGIKHKAEVINKAIERHRPEMTSALSILRHLGGFEIAALTGAYIQCAQQGTCILVDGYIATVAVLIAVKLNPEVKQWMLFAHASAEPGHKKLLAALAVEPILDLSMRLGEGSGAAVAVPVLQLACQLHNSMATFAEAGVSNKE
ncbi:MAG: nicotinate-nucleotide--dimethylbenzimidazole phosphoribosyltransferase [Gammaproteobacteria bacterium]